MKGLHLEALKAAILELVSRLPYGSTEHQLSPDKS